MQGFVHIKTLNFSFFNFPTIHKHRHSACMTDIRWGLTLCAASVPLPVVKDKLVAELLDSRG